MDILCIGGERVVLYVLYGYWVVVDLRSGGFDWSREYEVGDFFVGSLMGKGRGWWCGY